MRWSQLPRVLIGVLTALLVLMSPGGLVRAQTIRSGNVEIGQQGLAGDRASSKFEEYRHIPSGLFLNRLSLDLGNRNNHRYLQLRATRAAQENQRVFLRTGLAGKFVLEAQWDQTPHLLSLNGRSLFTQPTAGTFFLPLQTRQDLNKLLTTDSNPAVAGVQPDLTAIGNLVNGTARGVDLRTQRKTASVGLKYVPTGPWTVRVQYANEDRSGAKPTGATFQFASVNELPQPIDYQTQELKAGAEYATKRVNVQLNYTNSMFNNGVKALIWDNPFITTDAVGKPSRGRYALPPDNTAQNLAFSGAVKLPKTSRLAATVSYGWRRQDDPFLPHTINSAITNPGLTLPAASLKGEVNILATNFVLNTRPFHKLSVNARYRLYDYQNKSRSLTFPKYVGYGDYQLGSDARANLPIAHTRQNAGVDAGYQLVSGVSLKVGYGWEQWKREFRDAPKTGENALQTALNLTPTDWFALRTSYTHATRETHDYDFEKHVGEETFPSGETGLFGLEGVLPELRRFDMAARTRDLVNTVAQITPIDMLNLAASVGYTNDDFNKSEYGMLMNRGTQYSLDVDFSPVYRFGLFAGYTREDYKYKMKSRQRSPGTATTPPNDSPANDWGSDQKDKANTFQAGINGILIDKKLDTFVTYILSDTKGTVTSQKLGTGTLITTLENYPDTASKIHQLAAALRYHLSTNVIPRVEYRYEKYTESYFAFQNLQPYMGKVDATVVSSAFLGATQPGFTAHIITFMLGYQF